MMRVVIPTHLWRLANTHREIEIQAGDAPTLSSVLDALEAEYPVLRGTIRDHTTKQPRPFIRFFACGQDWTHEPLDTPLPAEVATGAEPLRVVGAMAGG